MSIQYEMYIHRQTTSESLRQQTEGHHKGREHFLNRIDVLILRETCPTSSNNLRETHQSQRTCRSSLCVERDDKEQNKYISIVHTIYIWYSYIVVQK